MKHYLLESGDESKRLDFQNKIDVYDIEKELSYFNFKPGDRILDAGCGNGNVISELLKNNGLLVHGIEREELRFFEAKKRFSTSNNVTIFQGDLEATNLSSKSYNKVICRYIFEHVVNPLLILQELKRLIENQGQIYIINFDDIFFNFHTKNHKLNSQLADLEFKLPQDVKIGRKLPQFLAQVGFSNIEWSAESFFFQGERMKLERENTKMRLIQLKPALSNFLGDESSYDTFANNYLTEMDDPNNVLFMHKFIIKASA